MYAINNDPQINRLSQAPQTSPVQGEVLQETIGVSLLDDLNQQLTDIAHVMKSGLEKKKQLREEINQLDPEKDAGTIDLKREELAGINSQSEMTMIQIQSLVDQRKNAMTMLSNLVASKSELLMSIARNLRN